MVEPIALSVKQAVEATSIGRTTLYAYISNGTLPAHRIGGRRLILVSDLKKLIESGNIDAPIRGGKK